MEVNDNGGRGIVKKLLAPLVLAGLILTGCAERQNQRVCVLQETGEQVADSRCEGNGEPGVTQWQWIQPGEDDDDDFDFDRKKHKTTTVKKPVTTTRHK